MAPLSLPLEKNDRIIAQVVNQGRGCLGHPPDVPLSTPIKCDQLAKSFLTAAFGNSLSTSTLRVFNHKIVR